MGICIKAILMITNFLDSANSLGKMGDIIKVSGRTTTCMEKDIFNGQMAKNSKDIMNMIKNKGKEDFNCVMEQQLKEHG